MFEKYLLFVSSPSDIDSSSPLVIEHDCLEDAQADADLYFNLDNDVAIYRRFNHRYHE